VSGNLSLYSQELGQHIWAQLQW